MLITTPHCLTNRRPCKDNLHAKSRIWSCSWLTSILGIYSLPTLAAFPAVPAPAVPEPWQPASHWSGVLGPELAPLTDLLANQSSACLSFFSPMPCAPWQLRRSFKLAYYSHTTQKISLVREATNKTTKQKTTPKTPQKPNNQPPKTWDRRRWKGETLRTSPTQCLSQMFSSMM